jgi:hypothetical protein
MPKIKDLGITVLPEGMRPLEIGGGAGGACGCTNVTNPCLGCTPNLVTWCGGCSFITNPCLGCTQAVTLTACGGCSFQTPVCKFGTCGITQTPCAGGTRFPTDITDHTPVIQPGTLAATDIAALRQQLKTRMDALDAHEKALGAEHFDAREQELQKELEQLQARRADLKK